MDFNGIRITYYDDPKGAFRSISRQIQKISLSLFSMVNDTADIFISLGSRRELKSLAEQDMFGSCYALTTVPHSRFSTSSS